jgi:phosphatidylglycerophosphate synthase
VSGAGAAIRDAVVVAGPGDAERRIAGVPLPLRTILVLQRNGVERVTLVGAPAPRDPRVRVAVTTAPAPAPAADEAPHLLVGAGSVVDGALVAALQRRARRGEVVEYGRDGARVRVAPGPQIAGNGGRPAPPPEGTLLPAALPDAALARALLRSLDNPRDGYLDGVCYRHVSRRLVTPLLLHTPLTPNAVTVLGVVAGVAGGLLLGVPGVLSVVAAVVLLVLSGAMDCADGELARLRFHESTLGHVLDVVGDTLVHVALLAGIALRLTRTGAVPGAGWLTMLAVGVVGAFVAITLCEVNEARRLRAPGWENRVIDGVLSPLTTRDWHLFPVAFAALGVLDWLVPWAAVGSQLFWLGTLVLCWRALRRAAPDVLTRAAAG